MAKPPSKRGSREVVGDKTKPSDYGRFWESIGLGMKSFQTKTNRLLVTIARNVNVRKVSKNEDQRSIKSQMTQVYIFL